MRATGAPADSITMNTLEIVETALRNREFVAEFNRLTGCSVGANRPATGIEAMIDNATGYATKRNAELLLFAAFVQDVVVERLPIA